MKQWLVFAGALLLLALAFPLANLVLIPPPPLWPLPKNDLPLAQAAPILQNKCMDCHTAGTRFPFYAKFPVAEGIIGEDIRNASAAWLMTPDKFADPSRFTEMELAKLEHVVTRGAMPPHRYLMLHWNAFLSGPDKDALLAWVRALRASRSEPAVDAAFRGDPVRPLVLPTGLDPQKIALGRALFHDARLSADNTLSCASCHALDKGGTDRQPVSTGIRGQKGGINSPTVYNAGLAFRQFWDGRAADLKEQANGPVANPIEMGSNWPEVLGKLKRDAALVARFRALYPDGLTSDNITDAIATFEHSLVTPGRFDRFLRGDRKALNDREQQGYRLFVSMGCASCHAGPALGGLSFEKMGAKKSFFDTRAVKEPDLGRFNVTQNPRDKHRFKVPTLRNIALTAPYFHDASATTLEEAVTAMARVQLGKELKPDEVQALTAFLEALSGEYEGKPLK